MTTRTERHRQMADEGHRQHLAAVARNVAGKKPLTTGKPGLPAGVVFYVPGESPPDVVMKPGRGWANTDGGLRELMMHWQKMPDFGIKERHVYPTEDGWLQVSYWWGTDKQGKKHGGWEANRVYTDENFNMTRVEAIVDGRTWWDLGAWVNDRPEEIGRYDIEDYMDDMDRMQPGK